MSPAPPPIIVCAPRSAGHLGAVVDSLQLETNPKYQPSPKRQTKKNARRLPKLYRLSKKHPNGLTTLLQIPIVSSEIVSGNIFMVKVTGNAE